MFTEILSEYFLNFQPETLNEKMFETKNGYEFEMTALLIKDEWYALVEHPDSSRLSDIDELVRDELEADVEGWRVLNKYQEELGAEIDFSRGDQEFDAITYDNGRDFCWLLKIEPKKDSRLVG